MNTRHVDSGERRRFNGWASAPEYVELRPIDGTAVALKAELIKSAQLRELLFFIQGLSLREGGTKRIAAEILAMFPDRIGTPTLVKAGRRITADQAAAVHRELRGRSESDFSPVEFSEPELSSGQKTQSRISEAPRTAEELRQICQLQAASELDTFLEELCCNPDLALMPASGGEFIPRVPYFENIIGALLEYKAHYENNASAEYIETSVGRIVFDAFAYALETGRSALVEGASGFGKTTALEACSKMNLGKARRLKLTGITNRTTFAQKLSDALGVACGKAFSPARKLIRCEEFLRRTKLMLVIDEGQYLWPQGKRIVSHPELINWLNTACYNEGVPFLISATKQFTVQRQAVERQTDWSSEQARRRIRRVFPIPDMPMPGDPEQAWHKDAIARMKQDLLKVASTKLGALGLGRVETNYLVGYAIASRGYFQTITDAIEDAQLIARRDGRSEVTAKDLLFVVTEIRSKSDEALVRVYDSKPVKSRRVSRVAAASQIGVESAEPAEVSLELPPGRRQAPLEIPTRRETQPVELVPG